MIVYYQKAVNGVQKRIPVQFHMKLENSGQCVRKLVGTLDETRHSAPENRFLTFVFKLKKTRTTSKLPEVVSCSNCEMTNPYTHLIVDDVHVTVNKMHLSMCSEFFHSLFNSDFKEKSQNEIPIHDVNLNDFQRLLSVINLKNPASPTDSDAEILLKLADRFCMQSVTNRVENHLMSASELPFVQLLKIADQYRLEELQKYCLRGLTEMSHVEFVSNLAEVGEFSESLKSKLFDKFTWLMKESKVTNCLTMATDSIQYSCPNVSLDPSPIEKEGHRHSKDGLAWVVNFGSGYFQTDGWESFAESAYMSWKFNWDVDAEVEQEIKGKITVAFNNAQTSMDVHLANSGEWICKKMHNVQKWRPSSFSYNLTLKKTCKTRCPATIINFTDPDFSNAVLVVDGFKINVNKNYLSMHSEYFNRLFNSDFKEKSMAEIPIEDVKFSDFQCLLGVLHPTNPTFPTDSDVEILLELADRFIMPAVTSKVENYLLINPNIPFARILKLADKFNMDKLLNRCLEMHTTMEHMKHLSATVNCLELSDSTKLKLFDKLTVLMKQ